MKAKEVAKLLGVSPYTIYKWYEDGKLEGFKISSAKNSHLFIDTLSIPAFKRKQTPEVKKQLTLTQFATELGVSDRTVRRWIKNGLVKAEFRDGRYFINTEEIV